MNTSTKNKSNLSEIILVLALTVIWNQGIYNGVKLITHSWQHYDMTTSVDLLVPFLPWTISIYFGCYLFWGINYFICAKQNDAERNRFFCADILAKGFCLLLFLFIPTTNLRPQVANDQNIWNFLMRFLYRIDTAENLFPSIHCLVSWLCWIGVRKNRDIPPTYRYFSLIAAIAVCISTLTTRQHVIADVFGGVFLAELCYFLSGFSRLCNAYAAILSFFFKVFKIKK